ncbi:MAG: PAS domain S-box protein [Armatimonadota bacterium]
MSNGGTNGVEKPIDAGATGVTPKRADLLLLAIVATAVALALLMILVIVFFRATPGLVEIPSFIPMVHTFAGLSTFCIAFMALGRHRVVGDPTSYWLGLAAGCTTILSALFLISWPGLLAGGQPLVGRAADAAGWNLVLTEFLFAVLITVAVLTRWPRRQSLKRRAWLFSVVGFFTATLVLGIVIIVVGSDLPALQTASGAGTPLRDTLSYLRLILFILASLLSFRKYLASRDKLTGYITLIAISMVFAAAARLTMTDKYALLWYLGRFVEVGSLLVALFGLLWEYVWLYRIEQEKSRLLKAAMAESERRASDLETILATLPAGVITCNNKGEIADINQAALELLGYTPEMAREPAAVRARRFKFVDTEGRTVPPESLLVPTLQGKTLSNRILSWQLLGGPVRWLNLSMAPFRDPDGHINRVIAAFVDTTAEREAQEELQRVAETLRQLVDAMPVNVLACDADGNYTIVNQPMRKTLASTPVEGVSPDDPAYPFRFPDGTPLPMSQMPLQQAMAQDGPVDHMLLKVRTADGRDLWHSLSARPLHSPDGKLQGAVSVGLDITDIVNAQAEMERLEHEALERVAEWETLFEALADEVLVIDKAGRVTKANSAARRAYGVAVGEDIWSVASRVQARYRDDTVPAPEDRPSTRALRGESVSGLREMYTDANGQTRHVLNSSSPLIVSGQIIGVVSIRHDITELIAAQEALAASERRYRYIGELMPWGAWVTDPSGETVYAASSFLELLGHDLDSLRQPGVWMDIVHPDDRQETSRAWSEAISKRSFLTMEYRVRDREGQYHWVLTRGAPVYDQSGQVEQWVGVHIDIDQIKRTEQELRTQREFLQAVLEQMPSGVMVVEAGTTRVLIGNRSIGRIWGRDMTGVVLRDFYADTEAEGPQGPFGKPEDWPAIRAIRGEIINNEILRIRQADGRQIHISDSAAPIRDESGNIFAAILTATDVTETVEAQEELARYRSHLEDLVQARTMEVEERSRLLESMFNNSPSGLVLLDPQFNFIRVNEVYAKACMRPIEDFVGHNHFVDYPSDELKATFEEVVRTKTPWQVFARPFQFPDHAERGTTYWDLSLVPILDRSGEVELLLFSLQDVTERTLAGRELAASYARLAESERKYRELVQDARSAIVHWGSDGTILFVNEYLEELFGYEPGELLGRHLSVLIPPKLSSGMSSNAMIAAIIAEPAAFAINENDNITKDGRILWMAWSNRVIHDDQGNVRAVMAVGLDRTEQHEAQLQLRRLTAELALAEQKERRRIATLLHDDIAQILAFTKMRLSSAIAIAENDVVKNILEESSGSLDEAIRGARSLTLELSAPVLYERGLVKAIEWLTPRIAQKHGFEAEVKVSGEVRPLEMDLEITLFQAVRELLTNIAKHAEARHVTIEMLYRPNEIEIQVADDGKGFVPHKARRTEEGGFGLLNVRERLQYLGGTFTIDSAPGRGTRIILVCPLQIIT